MHARRVRPRLLRTTVLALLGATAMVQAPAAQAQRPAGGSVRIPTDHWANYYIGRLRERGLIGHLNPLVQPWRAADIARAVAVLDPDTLTDPVREWVRRLREAFPADTTAAGARRPTGGASVAGALRASTSKRLDPARPLGQEGTWPRGQAGAWLEGGPLAAEFRLLGDRYYPDDPDGVDPEQSRGLRTDVAYVAADFPVASIELGRLARNWSRAGVSGLMLSDVATPYPQIGLELRAWRFVVRAFTGELEVLDGRRRYIAGHRIDYESPNLVLSFGEVNLYAPDAGGFSLRWLNPLEQYLFEGDN